VIEPTPEMADLFEQARRAYWVALDHTAEGMTVREHHRVATLQALTDVLAIVERDYRVEPRPRWEAPDGRLRCAAHPNGCDPELEP
jgi:hypothetical protein